MELLQGVGRCMEGLGGGALLRAVLGFPTLTPLALGPAPGFHGLLVLILFGLLVVNREAPLLLLIQRLGRLSGLIGGLAHRRQLLLCRFKALQGRRQPLLKRLAQGEQSLLLGQPLAFLYGGGVGPATRYTHHSQQGQQPETADHINPWAASTLTGQTRNWAVAPKWG